MSSLPPALSLYARSAEAAQSANRQVDFDIAAQPLDTALLEFSRQADMQVMIGAAAAGLAEKRTEGLKGRIEIGTALRRLLRDTDVRATLQGNTVTVQTATTSAASNIALAMPVVAPARNSGLAAAQLSSDTPVNLDEVVVTGSHIRGSQPAGAVPFIVDRQQIEASGYGRLQDVLDNLPQNFQGAGEEFNQLNAYNLNRGADVQLRGLGQGTTLVLVNGYRQAMGGLRGVFVDVSSIPTGAIERIEILSDGASAIYGSDAIGGVVNIILRTDYDGAETLARMSTADGEAGETQVSQLAGKSWSSGNALLGYQYYHRDDLPAASRPYASDNLDLRPYGGSDFRQFAGSPGTILNAAGQPAFAIPKGQNGRQLTRNDLIPGAANYSDWVTNTRILPEQDMHSAFLNASQILTDNWKVFIDGRYSRREFELMAPGSMRNVSVPSTNPFYVNPFGGSGPVTVAYDFTNDLGTQEQSGTTVTSTASASVTGDLPGEWQVRLSGSYARERNSWRQPNGFLSTSLTQVLADRDPATALNVFGDGGDNNPATLARLREYRNEQAVTTMESGALIADGPVLDAPGGPIRLAVGGDYRDERLHHKNPPAAIDRHLARTVTAGFAELNVPIVGAGNVLPLVRRLDLSLAGRYEDYSDFGSTFDPKVGVSWQPWESLRLRGTWGTSFRAPPFFQYSTQFSSARIAARALTDPKSPTGTSQSIVITGNNADLKEETANIWTSGFDWTPGFAPNLTLTATYFHINYDNQIALPGSSATALVQEDLWRGTPVVIRNPSPAQVAALCGDPAFIVDSCNGQIAAIVDVRTRNLSAVKIRGVDTDLSYAIPTDNFGETSFGVNATYTFNFKRTVTDTSPEVEIIDTVGNPLRLRARGYVSWSLGGWSANVALNYADDYRVATTPTSAQVDSWTTVDLGGGYRFANNMGLLSGVKVRVNAINAFDRRPPFVNSNSNSGLIAGYDGGNATLFGRMISAQFVKSW